MTILGFRDPYAFAKDAVLSLGMEDQNDQLFLDTIDKLTRDQASYLRLLMLHTTTVEGVVTLTKDRLSQLIYAAQNFQLIESQVIMH
jgi:hypothetical protein